MPLGQVLMEEGLITRGQLAAALQRQAEIGGRLGTNLVEMRWATIDQIGRALARLHGVPAALQRHLDGRDAELARLIPRKLALELIAVPVATSRDGRLVVCMRDPAHGDAIRALGDATRLVIVPCVAAEIALYPCLSEAYHVPLASRFGGDAVDVDVDFTPVPVSVSEFDFASSRLELVELDHGAVARDDSQKDVDARTGGSSISRSIPLMPSARAGVAPKVGMIAAAPAATAQAPRVPSPLSFAEASAAIGSAALRDEVAAALLDFARGVFSAALMLVVKDVLALGLRGFGGNFSDDTVESIVLPLSAPSLFRTCTETMQPFIGTLSVERDGSVQERFFKLFPPANGPREVALVPIVVRDRVVCLIYGHGRSAASSEADFDRATTELVALARIAGDAYVRILRAAKQK